MTTNVLHILFFLNLFWNNPIVKIIEYLKKKPEILLFCIFQMLVPLQLNYKYYPGLFSFAHQCIYEQTFLNITSSHFVIGHKISINIPLNLYGIFPTVVLIWVYLTAYITDIYAIVSSTFKTIDFSSFKTAKPLKFIELHGRKRWINYITLHFLRSKHWNEFSVYNIRYTRWNKIWWGMLHLTACLKELIYSKNPMVKPLNIWNDLMCLLIKYFVLNFSYLP